jgi:MFS family permease
VAGDRRGANPEVVRLLGADLLAVMAEWASAIAVLVYAFEQDGSAATGLASLAILAPVLVGAPLAARLTNRHSPVLVRRVGLLLQVVGYGVAAVAAGLDAPVTLVVLPTVVALTALCMLRPTTAVLLPSVVRSTEQLTRSNLWGSYSECASALLGPAIATGLLALAGPPAALGACTAMLLAGFLFSVVGAGTAPDVTGELSSWQPERVRDSAAATLRERPWTASVLGVVLARSALLGALDVLLVVIAFESLDLGGGGAGLLSTLVGVGAAVSAVVATMVVRRSTLAPSLAVGLAVAGAGCLAFGVATELPVALVVLPVLGLVAALLNNLSRMLLQRAADPRLLGSLFSLVELVGGVGLLVGSGLAQLLVALADASAALVGVGVLLLLVLLVTARSLRRSDEGADVPVVEMALLKDLPMFAPLPPLELEVVSRSAEPVHVAAGEVVLTQGEHGDVFFAVVEGALDIVMSGEHIRTAERGSFFGEVALLADVTRTATVTATTDSDLLAIERAPFLIAVTGDDTSRSAAWGVVRSLRLETELPAEDPPAPTR